MKTLLAAAALALLPLAARVAAADPAAEAGAPARFSVEVVGTGPDVILIPGLATPRAVWRDTAEALRAGYRVHLVQVRGFGEAAGTNAEGPVLEPFVAYIRAQGLERPAVIGHSLGGLAALMLGAEYPELPGGLMIVDALPFYSVLAAQPGSEVTAQSIEPRARALRNQLAASYGRPIDPAVAQETAASQALTPEARAQVAEWVLAADPRVTAQLLYDDMTTDMRERVAAITVPVTVIYPWNESYPTEAQAGPFYRSQYAALPEAEFVAIGPAGHFVMLDRPAATQAAIAAFLEQ